jgi:hypothetical protein
VLQQHQIPWYGLHLQGEGNSFDSFAPNLSDLEQKELTNFFKCSAEMRLLASEK